MPTFTRTTRRSRRRRPTRAGAAEGESARRFDSRAPVHPASPRVVGSLKGLVLGGAAGFGLSKVLSRKESRAMKKKHAKEIKHAVKTSIIDPKMLNFHIFYL